MSYRTLILWPHELAPYVDELRAIERSITYPLGESDHFYIDHGPGYARFFEALGEQAGFIVALDGDRVVGTLAGVRRRARLGDAYVQSLYLADYKVHRDYRGRGVAPAMVWKSTTLLVDPVIRPTRVFYSAAMRGARGDVMRSARGRNVIMRLARPIARLAIYFTAPEQLAALDLTHAPPPPRGLGLDLSPDVLATARGPGIVSTAGRKDLRLVSTGAPWPLEHLPLGPQLWTRGLGAYLRACGETLCSADTRAQGCFALDERRGEEIRWLRGQGVTLGAQCTVYALRLPPARGTIDYVHLATSEI